jgi:hypothetical protein
MSKFTDLSPMPFGKYEGRPMGKIPPSYLLYLSKQGWLTSWKDVYDYIQVNKHKLISKVGGY